MSLAAAAAGWNGRVSELWTRQSARLQQLASKGSRNTQKRCQHLVSGVQPRVTAPPCHSMASRMSSSAHANASTILPALALEHTVRVTLSDESIGSATQPAYLSGDTAAGLQHIGPACAGRIPCPTTLAAMLPAPRLHTRLSAHPPSTLKMAWLNAAAKLQLYQPCHVLATIRLAVGRSGGGAGEGRSEAAARNGCSTARLLACLSRLPRV